MRAFLYAGQGSQFVGMGKDFYESFPEYREEADAACLDFDYLKLMAEGPAEVLSDTRYTQGCMAVFAAGVTEILGKAGIRPDAACGLSLGEYGALYAAGVWDTKTYIDLVNFRGKAMADAAKGTRTAMSAVLRTEAADVVRACGICKEGYVTVSNYNCPGQYVICGEEEAVAWTENYLKVQHRSICKRLNTSGPFHTKLLKAAGDALCEKFAETQFAMPNIPVAMNVTGKMLEKDEDIKDLLVRQVQTGVRFEDDMRTLLAEGITDFIEIGPGNVLAGLLKKTAKAVGTEVNVVSISSVADMEKVTA